MTTEAPPITAERLSTLSVEDRRAFYTGMSDQERTERIIHKILDRLPLLRPGGKTNRQDAKGASEVRSRKDEG